MKPASLFPVGIILCSLVSTAKFATSLGIYDKQQAKDHTEIITSNVGSYEIVAHISLFFERRHLG
jgi:hypothetical protein